MIDDVRNRSRVISSPVGRSVSVITESDAVEIAGKHHRSLAEVYIAALEADIWPYRYVRNYSSLTSREQQTFAKSTVAVIGCGGLGGYALLMLARIGIGSLVVVDPDVFDETNLNRQAFAFANTLGMHKTEAAVSAIQSVNPMVAVSEFPTAINCVNAPEILSTADVVVDALDNLPDREMLRQVTRRMKLPLVHGAVAGFEGQVMTVFPEDTGCSDLFRDGDGRQTGRETDAELILGVPSIAPVFIASLQAMEVVKILLKRGKPANGRILYADIELGEFNYFDMTE